MVVLTGWSRLKNLARGDQGNEEPVLRRCWTFLSDCAAAAVQDVVQQVSPIPVHDLGALTGVYLGRDGQRDRMNIEMNVQWADDNQYEQAALDGMEVDLGLLDPGLLKDPVAACRPAEGSCSNDKHECESGGHGASGGNDKRSAASLPAASRAANEGGEKPAGPDAHNGDITCHVAVTPPTAKSPAKNHSKRSGRCVKRPPRFEEDEESVAADAVATTKSDPKRPRSRPEPCYTEAQIESKFSPGFFDHPQEDEVGVQDDWALPSRYLQKWRLFRKIVTPDQRNGKPLWFPESDFPQNDDMSEYALEGYLIAPTLRRVRIRLDQIETLYFDRYQSRRGWWVSAHDGKELTAYYRLMEPDETVSMPEPAPEDAPYLRQRALLAVLSSLLSVGLPIADEESSSLSDHPQDVILDPYLDRVRADGVDVLPILRMFADNCKPYLKCLFLYSDEESMCTLPLEDLPRRNVEPAALLEATIALERVAGIRPWGVPVLETPRKRKPSPARSPTNNAKKMCFENTPTLREVSEGSPSPTESSQNSLASQASNRQTDTDTPPPTNFTATLTERRNGDLLSVVEFKGLFSDDELEDLEECNDVRFGGGSSEHQYGRILPDAADYFFRLMDLSRDDSFVDLGSGIGSLVLQAAYTIGCPSRGIEIVKGRHEAALELQEYTVNRIQDLNLSGIHPGTVVFFNQDLISQDASSVLQEAIRDAVSSSGGGKLKAFVNNYEGIMGDRSPGARTGMSPENYIAGQFASWPPGSQLVTISPLRGMGTPLAQALDELRKHELTAGNPTHSSFFRLDEIYVGPQNEVASWSSNSGCTKDVFAYRYTRLEQDSDSDHSGGTSGEGANGAMLLCSNPKCPVAQAGTSIPAVRLDDKLLPLVNTCSCSYQPKALRRPLQRWL